MNETNTNETNGVNGLGGQANLSKDTSNQQTYDNSYGQTGQYQGTPFGQNGQQTNPFGQNGQQTNPFGQNGQQENQYGQTGQGFNQQFGGPNNMANMGSMAAMAGGFIGASAPDYMLWLILGIVQICTLCCCNCTAPITGIITVILVVMGNTSYKQGNLMDYQSKMKIAKIVCGVGFGLMIIGWIISLFSGMFEFMLSSLS